MRAISATLAAVLGPLIIAPVPALAQPSIDPAQAAAVFAVADAVAREDGGRLWGVSLAGPIVLVDPATRAAVCSRADPAGAFAAEQGVFVGVLPKDMGVANTAVTWGTEKWTMLLWPITKDPGDRRSLLAHELWHRIQGDLKLSAADRPNGHLDTLEGRYWMRLEFRALARALEGAGEARASAAADALAFRARRRSLFPDAPSAEISLENNEGLAEYTGVVLADDADGPRLQRARKGLDRGEQQDTYARSFAYATGPAYGLLLDAAGANWRADQTVTRDLAERLADAMKIPASDRSPEVAPERAVSYGGAAVRAQEEAREQRRQERVADYQKRLVDGPRLRLALRSARYEFDPRSVTPLDPLGTVYPSLTIRDAWGTLTVKQGGALMGSNWDYVAVPAGTDTPPRSDDWTLELKDGYELVPGPRPDDWAVERIPPGSPPLVKP